MAPIVSTIEIGCPPDEVFGYATDPSRFPDWQLDVSGVHIDGAGAPGVGTRFVTTRRIGRVEQKTTQQITEMTPPRTWAARGTDPMFRPNAHITVEPLADGSRSQVTIALDFAGRGIGRLLPLSVIRRMAAKSAPRSYQRLKEQLESRAQHPG